MKLKKILFPWMTGHRSAMKRTFANLLLGTIITLTGSAWQIAAAEGGASARQTVMVMGQPMSLRVPDERVRVDWDWEGEFDYGETGDVLVGSGLSYYTSPQFAVGGSYAMAVQSRSRSLIGVDDVDPARYTVFMRWQF